MHAILKIWKLSRQGFLLILVWATTCFASWTVLARYWDAGVKTVRHRKRADSWGTPSPVGFSELDQAAMVLLWCNKGEIALSVECWLEAPLWSRDAPVQFTRICTITISGGRSSILKMGSTKQKEHIWYLTFSSITLFLYLQILF